MKRKHIIPKSKLSKTVLIIQAYINIIYEIIWDIIWLNFFVMLLK